MILPEEAGPNPTEISRARSLSPAEILGHTIGLDPDLGPGLGLIPEALDQETLISLHSQGAGQDLVPPRSK